MEPQKKRRCVLRSEARNIVRRIIMKCDQEAAARQYSHPVHQVNARVSYYTGVSRKTISKIRKLSAEYGDKDLPSPKKPGGRGIKHKFHCTDEDKMKVRNTIYNFHIEKKLAPTGPKLLTAIKEKMTFPWGYNTFLKLLKSMGFEWKKATNTRGYILIEKLEIVRWRRKYLETVKHYRLEGKNIIYAGKTYIDHTLPATECAQSEKTVDMLKNSSSSHRYIIIHAGGRMGFIKSAGLVFESHNVSDDCKDEMNAAVFEKWVMEKLIPNIPSNSVIVFDNAPCHSEQLNKVPSKYATKSDMINWLTEHKIHYTDDMLRCELYELIERNKNPEKVYKIDTILKNHGHTVLRLPLHMPELNPIEMAWANVKCKISVKNIGTVPNLEKLINEAIDSVTLNDWEIFCKDIENLERDYYSKDKIIEELIDEIPINLQSDSESESGSESHESTISDAE